MYPIDVDGPTFAQACDGFYDANHDVIDAVTTLSGKLDSGSAMAGTDSGGEGWAAQYDPAAAQALQAGCDLGASMGTIGNLLNGSLVNHDAADGGAAFGYSGGPDGPDDGDANPNHYAEQLQAPAPPTAAGGIGDEPGWWHWISSHLEGLLWPDADTGKLRSIGDAWNAAATSIDQTGYELSSATSLVSMQKSPEIDDAVAACNEVQQHATDLASAYRDLGSACHGYADDVDKHHQEIEDQLKSFIEWTVGIEAVGGIVSFFTAGIAEAPTQAVEASEVASAASKVRTILQSLLDLAETVGTAIGRVLTKITEITGKLGKFLSAAVDKALVKFGLKEAEENLPKLASDAKQLQKKFKHAKDFGVEGNYNPANAAKFEQKLNDFIDDPATTRVRGTYRGDQVILNYSKDTGQVVVQDTSGNFVSGWKMTPAQLKNVIENKSLGGS